MVKLVPVPKAVPPVATSYQVKVPPEAVAPSNTVPAPVLEPGVVPVTVTEGVMVKVLVEVTLPHGVFPNALRVKVTLPAEISAALGVYVQVVKELALAKVPVPLEVQAILE